jgi:transposase
MSVDQFTCLFRYFEGYRVVSVAEVQGKDSPEYLFTLEPEPEGVPLCERCGEPCRSIHDRSIRQITDLPVFGLPVRLLLPRRRVWCRRCGPALERLSWLGKNARITQRLADFAASLLVAMTVRQAAAMLGLDWKTVRSIDKLQLQDRFGQLDMSGVRLLAMDEFAIQKGHRYATVVIDYETRKVLWIGRGRTRAEVRPFFEGLTEEQRSNIKAVAMDMNASYELEVKLFCPQAEIVFDLFHVVAKYGREVIGRVRVDEANRLRADKQERKLVKSSHWLLLRNRENTGKESDRVRLDELLSANAVLMTVYVLKDDLKEIWKQTSEPEARSLWEAWIQRALESGVQPLMQFAKRLAGYVEGIISSSRWKLNTSVLEGINNRIKVIKRMAYGYRDDEHFFLKIKAAFPGNRR